MMTDDGDFVIDASGDLSIAFGDEQKIQEIIYRLKTQQGDWVLSPRIGADLEQFIGRPNTPDTHLQIEEAVREAITLDGLLFFPTINAVSVSKHEVFILIEFKSIETDGKVIQAVSILDLRKGLVFARVQE